MTTEKTKEVKQPVKRTFQPESAVKASISRSVQFVLTSEHLAAENKNYILRMEDKLRNNKQLTTNEVAGLAKIERALQRVVKGTYRTGESNG